MLEIKPATSKDTLTILNFIKSLAEFEKLSHEVVATEEALRKSLFEEKRANVLLAFWDQKPVGFALYFYNYSTFLAQSGLYLEDLFVDPNCRSRGIGLALIKALAAEAKAQSCGRMEWSVLNWNKRAISFYESIGGQLMTDWSTVRLTEESIKTLAQN